MAVSLACFTPSDSAGFSLKLIPRFSPESPLYPGNLSQSERIQKMVEISHARANYLVPEIPLLWIPKTSISRCMKPVPSTLQNFLLEPHKSLSIYSLMVVVASSGHSAFLA
ncbi:hypothetical protein FH972_020396 [Carpinus fangiana]|uniref:Uncharacterized protein n=1 Tax=Carpinus fangiana TaxID=176857 RepID=A0A5N6RWK3_9ROSI|nr:hypothetical protein FH972_020396 [Carpinus fangiana]